MNRVHLIDCEEYVKRVNDNHYDLAIIDAPYGIKRFNKKSIMKHTETKKPWNNKPPSKEYWKNLFRISRNQIIFGGNYFKLPPCRCFLIWDKGESAKGRSFAECEYMWTSFDDVARIYKEDNTRQDKQHPAQKPIALYKWLLQNYAKPGQTVFDSHTGSGSIRIACHDLGFDFEGCELDPDYHAAQEKRYQNHIQQSELFGKEEIQDLVYREDK